ncbi:galactokinase [Mucilaginibacter hurinus]|uniref:Galactokinase n=1 Tax=Mucilaginibacter hurinus TaxID=2201324 RepID=A0A367GQJ3_9SPHI|nr:galactokinase [Mucilaginibacter hurinus]RCH55136.1 galactokinase [Mucilaginibacter hurinus]
MTDRLHNKYEEIFGKKATNDFFSPGRVNLIGEHIDYNGGLVMPCAITFGTYLLVSFNDDQIFRFRSLNVEETADIELRGQYHKTGESWYNFPLGVADYFLRDGKELKGMDMLFYGDIPIGSGLSSSASIEVVTAYALNELFDAGYSKLDLVKISKWVENDFIGVNCGIMDQFAVAFGEKDKALMLNCDTLDYQAVDTNLGDYVLAIINTNKSRKLAESKYNERVQECAAALSALQQELEINHLCDINTETYDKYRHLVKTDLINRRATHVIAENDRVKQAAKVLAENNLGAFGQLMYASHDSLRDLYEVSGKELDTIVEYCRTNTGVAGARMTGAGFGGCAVALVKRSGFDKFSSRLTQYYEEKIGYAPSIYSSLIGDGVGGINRPVNSGDNL